MAKGTKNLSKALTAVPEAKGLTDKQVAFCRAYAETFNGAKSMRHAGYTETSAKTDIGYLLSHPGVQAYIRYLYKLRELGPEQIADILRALAVSDVRDFVKYDENGLPSMVPTHELSEDAAKNVKEVIVKKRIYPDGSIEVTEGYRLHDKLKALELLCKATGMFTDTTNVLINTAPTIVQVSGGVDLEAI